MHTELKIWPHLLNIITVLHYSTYEIAQLMRLKHKKAYLTPQYIYILISVDKRLNAVLSICLSVSAKSEISVIINARAIMFGENKFIIVP